MEDNNIRIDVSKVLGLQEDEQQVDEQVMELLSKYADTWANRKIDGVLIVVGNFYSGTIPDMDFISGDNLITEDDRIWVTDDDAIEHVTRLSNEPNDGAIVVHLNGKIIAAGVNLIMHDLSRLKEARSSNVPQGGMRHIAGIYASLRDDVLSSFISSGETGRLTHWKNGQRVKQYDPQKEEKEPKKAPKKR